MIFYCIKNTKDFYKLKVQFLLAIASYAQSTQNSKFVIALHISANKRGMELTFLHADKHQIGSYRLIQ